MADPQDELAKLAAQVASLTTRIYQLEQRIGISPPEPRPSTSEPRVQTSVPPYPIVPRPSAPVTTPTRAAPSSPRAKSASDSEGLESKIGKFWLNRIGILAILIGLSYFIKYAFDNGWIGPSGKITLGVLAGIGVILWSEVFRRKGYAAFSYSLKALGVGTLYLSLWGAYQVYHLIPSAPAFLAMIVVTASTIVLSLTQDAEILAAFAMIGGFSTPVLLSSGENHEVVLFCYTALLDLAVLGMTISKPWRRLLIGSFIGTAILYIGWFSDYYTKDQRGTTVFFTLLFGAIFAVIPLFSPLTSQGSADDNFVTLMLLPLCNAAGIFLVLFSMYRSEQDVLTWYALALAAAYLLLSSQFKRRTVTNAERVKVINLLHVAIAIGFITIAIPLKLSAHWITIGWLVESAVLLFIAFRTQTGFLRFFAGAALALGIVRLLFYDNFHVQTLIFNARFATYLVAVVILAGIVRLGKQHASLGEMPYVYAAEVCLNLLALMGLTLEASDYFQRQLNGLLHAYRLGTPQLYEQTVFARNFSYSAIWLVYGVGLMLYGFWKRAAFERWQALLLIAFTIAKVFIYDVSELEQGYRIASFVALGAVLMGISYVYHRDWLSLSGRSANPARERHA